MWSVKVNNTNNYWTYDGQGECIINIEKNGSFSISGNGNQVDSTVTPQNGSGQVASLSNLKNMLNNLGIKYNFTEENNSQAKGTFDFGPVTANVELAYGGSDSWTASFSLSLDFGSAGTFPLSGSVEIDETETIFSVNLPNTISLGPVELSGTDSTPNKPFSGVPALKITCEEGKANKVSIQSGVNFLSTSMADIEIGIGRVETNGKKELQLSFTVTTPPFNGATLELAMTYSKSAGLEIENWPDFTLANAANIWKEIEEQYDNTPTRSECEELVKQVVGDVFSNTFIITPTIGIEGEFLTIGMAGSYEVEISAVGTATITIDLPSITIKVEKDTTFSELASFLTSQIAQQIAVAILEDEEMLGKFLAALFAQKLAEKIMAALLCKIRGPVTPPPPPGGPILPPIGDGDDDDDDDSSDDDDDDGDDGEGGDDSDKTLPRLTTPVINIFQFNDTTEQIEVEWSVVADAVGYLIEVIRVKDDMIAKTHLAEASATSWYFSNEKLLGFANYKIRIIAQGKTNVNWNSEPGWSSNSQTIGTGPQT